MMQMASFAVGDDKYAVPVLMIEEFFRPLPVTPVPRTSPLIEGLIHLRGKTATVLNLRRCLEKPAAAEGANSKMILIVTEAGLTPEAKALGIVAHSEPVALRIDCTSRILTVGRDLILPTPAHIRHSFVSGVIRCAEDNSYVMVLDIRRLIEEILEVPQEAAQAL